MAPNHSSKFKPPIITSSADSSQSSNSGSPVNHEDGKRNLKDSTAGMKSPNRKKLKTGSKKASATSGGGEPGKSVEKCDENPRNTESPVPEKNVEGSNNDKSAQDGQNVPSKKKKRPSSTARLHVLKEASVTMTNEEYDRIFDAVINGTICVSDANDTENLINHSEDLFSPSLSDLEDVEGDADTFVNSQDVCTDSGKASSSSGNNISEQRDTDPDSENRLPEAGNNMITAGGAQGIDEDVIPCSQVVLRPTPRTPLAAIQNSTVCGGANTPEKHLSWDISSVKAEPTITFMAELSTPTPSQPPNDSQQNRVERLSGCHAAENILNKSQSPFRSKELVKKASQKSDSDNRNNFNSCKINSQPLTPIVTPAIPTSESKEKAVSHSRPSTSLLSQGSSTHSHPLSQSSKQATGSQTSSQSKSQVFNLSQPPSNMSCRQRLYWLQERRAVGLWVQCDHKTCGKWRYLPEIHDPTTLPTKWHCSLHPDESFNTCEAPEKRASLHAEEDMIFNTYTAGSLVWARLTGYPWWPAMVDDDPDLEQFYWLNEFSDIPTWYHVVFLEENRKISRAWVETEHLKPFKGPEDEKVFIDQHTVYLKRIEGACRVAYDAQKYDILERLRRFSFISQYKGVIGSKKQKSRKSDADLQGNDDSDGEESLDCNANEGKKSN